MVDNEVKIYLRVIIHATSNNCFSSEIKFLRIKYNDYNLKQDCSISQILAEKYKSRPLTLYTKTCNYIGQCPGNTTKKWEICKPSLDMNF